MREHQDKQEHQHGRGKTAVAFGRLFPLVVRGFCHDVAKQVVARKFQRESAARRPLADMVGMLSALSRSEGPASCGPRLLGWDKLFDDSVLGGNHEKSTFVILESPGAVSMERPSKDEAKRSFRQHESSIP